MAAYAFKPVAALGLLFKCFLCSSVNFGTSRPFSLKWPSCLKFGTMKQLGAWFIHVKYLDEVSLEYSSRQVKVQHCGWKGVTELNSLGSNPTWILIFLSQGPHWFRDLRILQSVWPDRFRIRRPVRQGLGPPEHESTGHQHPDGLARQQVVRLSQRWVSHSLLLCHKRL